MNENKPAKETIDFIKDAYNQAGVPFKSVSLGTLSKLNKLYIGQTVHYYDHYHHQRAAIVTAIHRDNEEVDLCVLYPTRQDFLLHVKHDADHEKETWDFI